MRGYRTNYTGGPHSQLCVALPGPYDENQCAVCVPGSWPKPLNQAALFAGRTQSARGL
jgi:hypothetical protein